MLFRERTHVSSYSRLDEESSREARSEPPSVGVLGQPFIWARVAGNGFTGECCRGFWEVAGGHLDEVGGLVCYKAVLGLTFVKPVFFLWNCLNCLVN